MGTAKKSDKKLDKKNIEDIFALTPMQEGILFHYLKDPAGEAYFEQLSLEISGKIDVNFFEKSWNVVIEANEMLRTVFRWEKVENPIQIILKDHKVPLKFYDISSRETNEKKCELENIKDRDRKAKFNLKEVPFRITFCQIEKDKYEVIISNHHILYDGWSNGIILEEFFDAYNDLSSAKEWVKPVKTKFKEFIKWIQNQDNEKQVRYWKQHLKGVDARTEIPIKRKKKENQYQDEWNGELSIPLQEEIESFVKAYKITLSAFFYTCWAVLLQKYNNCEDVVFGTTVSGRSVKLKGIEDMVGLFINTLPLRVIIPSDEPILEAIGKIDHRIKGREEYEATPLVNIKEYSEIDNKDELFDSILVVENYPLRKRLTNGVGDLLVDSYSIFERTHYDLTVSITISTGLTLCYFYYREVFDKDAVMRMHRHFITIMRAAAAHPAIKVPGIVIVSGEERKQILYQFNGKSTGYPIHKTIDRLYREQADKTPDNIAVVGTNTAAGEDNHLRLTYRELNKKSDQLAGYLLHRGLKPEEPVGISAERCINMVIGILGVLKAGGAYLPIDPDYPEDRLQYISTESNTKILLTTTNIEKKLSLKIEKTKKAGVDRITSASNAAYVIYTSGSTGRPKGVLVEHSSVINILFALQKQYPLMESDVYLLKTAAGFDVSVTELFGWFLGGGRLAILEKGGEKDPGKIFTTIENQGVTHLNFVPSMFNIFLEFLEQYEIRTGRLGRLRYIFLAGEVIKPVFVRRFRRLHLDVRLENIYGPTEGTIYTTGYSINCWNGDGSVPIGKSLTNIRVYILDRYWGVQPIGVPGELCIGGRGLARGYLNRPQLTGEKFILINRKKPVNRELPMPIIRYLYKTGDLARWFEDGNIEFLGRMDNQVKIRGFRIELGEIETLLLEYPGVKEVIVLAKSEPWGNQDTYLCAYVVPAVKSTVEPLELRKYLSCYLPDYMVPTFYIALDRIPLTPNGKIEMRALPKPGITAGKSYTPPRDAREKALVQIWADVLKVDSEKIGIDNDFFQLGGHSLKATTLISRIHHRLRFKIPLEVFFDNSSIRGLSEYLKNSHHEQDEPIRAVEKREYYVLSSAQKRLYFLHQLAETGIVYNMTSVWILAGTIDKNKLEQTFKELVNRHESLRTSFVMPGEEPGQRVHDEVKFEFEYYDLAIGDTGEEETGDRRLKISCIVEGFVRPFDLSKTPLLRVGLIKVEKEKHILAGDMHHIISDGISARIMVRDFTTLFSGEQLPLPGLQYKDYAEWQIRNKKSGKLLEQKRYWLKEFDGEIPVLNLPTDYVRPGVQHFEGSSLRFEIDKECTGALNTLALEEGVTLFMVLTASFNIFLAKISNQEDIVMGTPIAGRRHEDLERIIGMFVNTLILRNDPGGEKTFREFLAEIKNQTLKAFENQDYPFEELVEQVALKRASNRNPLFDVMFIFQNIDEGGIEISNPDPGSHIYENYEYENNTSKFDLTLETEEVNERLSFSMKYNTKLFKEETVQRFTRYFKKVVSQILVNPENRISEIEIIPIEEKKILLYEFNNTYGDYPGDKKIHELFAEQAERTPDRMALLGDTQKVSGREGRIPGIVQLSYRELNEKTNRLALLLSEKGVQPDTIVGIMIERSLEAIMGILGILKSGGAFLPIAPDYPQGHIDFMLKDSKAKILLTDDLIIRDTQFKQSTQFTPSSLIQLSRFNPSHQCAYVIFTSGSTGKPKGVLVEHSSLINFVLHQEKFFKIGTNDRLLQFSTICFDASMEQIFTAFLNGALLVLVDKYTLLDNIKFEAFISRHSITHLHAVPLFLNNLNLKRMYSLKRVVSGGDVCPPRLAKKWRRHCDFYNKYGPTETTITSIEVKVKKNGEPGPIVPLGRPISNTAVYLLDKWMKPVPMGTEGEIYIGGAGLARGYLNRPELTGEKFVTSSLINPGHPELLFKTGDMARWLPDGNIEFLGRKDFQVKIRGYRIELGEIEDRLLKHPGIKDAVVVLNEKTDKHLCANVVSNEEVSSAQLRDYLINLLPHYMIPSYFIRLEEIPLTPNGKLNRKALPEPEFSGAGRKITAPRDEIEKKLVEIWCKVLSRDPLNTAQSHMSIGIDDNFFELGGHSLKTNLLVSRIHKELNVKIPLIEVFKRPTIRRLAGYIKGMEIDTYISIEPAEAKEYYESSSAQKRLYFLQQIDEDNTAYNISGAIILEDEIDKARLENGFRKLIKRHESFRTSLRLKNNELVQQIHDEVDFEVEYYNHMYSPLDLETAAQNFVRPFDLSNAPLLRVGVLSSGESTHLLIIDIHHIISDGLSHEILVKDFMVLYSDDELPLLRLQYKDFSQWQNCQRRSETIAKHREYWLKQFSRKVPPLNLPVDFPRCVGESFAGNSIYFNLENDTTGKLKSLAAREDVTLYMLLYAVVSVLMAKLSGNEDIVIGCPIEGRSHPDLHVIIGMFVNTLSIRSFPEHRKTFKEFLEEVKGKILEAFDNRDYQFEDLVEALTVDRDVGRNPIFDVLLASQNFSRSGKKYSPPGNSPLKYQEYKYEHKKAKFDLMILYMEIENDLSFQFSYRTKLYKQDTIEKFAGYFKEIVSIITKTPEKKISALEIISQGKKNELIDRIKEEKNNTLENIELSQGLPGILNAEFDY